MATKNDTKPLAEIVQKSLAKITKNAELVSDAEEMEVSRKEIKAAEIVTGYMARAMALATIPHKKLPDDVLVYKKQNGDYTLSLLGHPNYGLPYGTIPRMLMSFVTMEAVRTQEPTIILGNTLSDFMEKLGYVASWGKRGMVKQLKEQAKRLFSTGISCVYENPNRGRTIHQVYIASDYSEWWLPYDPNQRTLWESKIVLSHEFFKEIVNRPVPISLKSLANLRKSPMALDIYFWLTHRNFSHSTIDHIGIDLLQQQFGASYPLTPQGKRDFKKRFSQALKKVSETYAEAGKLRFDDDVLVVIPGRPDVAKLPAHKGVKVPADQRATQQQQPKKSSRTAPVAAHSHESSFVAVDAIERKIAPRSAEETPAEAAARCLEMQKSIAESKAKGIGTFFVATKCGSLLYCTACQKTDFN